MAKPPAPTDILPSLVAALKEALGERLVALILFGSRARREAHPGSDWDVFLIATELPRRFWERHLQLKQALPAEFRGAVSLLAATTREFESRISSLYLDLALEGQILYDPEGYATRRLAALRQRIAELGLKRQQTPAGSRWKWSKKPPRDWMLGW